VASKLDGDGERHLPVQGRAARHPRGSAEQLLATGKALSLLLRARLNNSHGDCREKARPMAATRLSTVCGVESYPGMPLPHYRPLAEGRRRTGETVDEYHFQGRVVWQNENLDDLVRLLATATRPTSFAGGGRRPTTVGISTGSGRRSTLINSSRQKRSTTALIGTSQHSHIPLIHGPCPSNLLQAPRRAGRRLPTAPCVLPPRAQ